MKIPEYAPTISTLLERLQSTTVADVFQEPGYAEFMKEVESKYDHWEKVKYKARARGLDPELLWLRIKLARTSTSRQLPLLGHLGRWLTFNTPDLLLEELMHIDQQFGGHLMAPDKQPIAPGVQERFMIRARREEAIASSMLEGAATTRRDATRMLASGRKPRTTGERMVMNNYQAISFIREHRDTPLTPEFILDIQRILTEGTLERTDECGRFRTTADDVAVTDQYGHVLHQPPSADELHHRLAALCSFANHRSPTGFIHPVIRACAIHFQIGFDHPFCDGNGRTARVLFYWSMLNAGFWQFEFLPISRIIYAGPARYARAYLYTETDDGDLTYFLAYKAGIIRRARQELAEYISRKHRQAIETQQVYDADHRLNHRQRDAIARVLNAPRLSLTVQDHRDRHNIAYATARADLLALATWEYLTQSQSGKRFVFARGPKLSNTNSDGHAPL